MLIEKIKEIRAENIPNTNPSPKKYFILTSNENKNLSAAFETNALAGQLVAFQLHKRLKNTFSEDTFIEKVSEHFKNKLSDPEHTDVITRIYLTDGTIPVLTPLMYMAKPYASLDTKTKKSLDIFQQMLQPSNVELDLEIDLNFIEQDIYSKFHEYIEADETTTNTKSYTSFLDTIFSKDFLFLLKNQQYFKAQIDRFLKFYLFIYAAQLALNIHSSPLDVPSSKELYFILNHEKASSERKNLQHYGFKTLIDKARYMFPYLSLLENLTDVLELPDLKYYHFSKIQETPENLETLDNFTKLYRNAKSLPDTLFKSESISEAVNALLNSTMEQFRSDKKAVIDRFTSAFEKQIAAPFFQSRGRSGNVLILDQDAILLLTNLAIGDRGQLRFQELMDEFRLRSVYLDPRSEDALLELYERVGNVDRKSDSGDAVYVKAI